MPTNNRRDVERIAKDLLLQVMAEKRWKATQLAREMSRSPDLVRRWLRDERRLQLEDVVALAHLGGYSLDELFGLAERPATGDINAAGLEDQIQRAVERALVMWAGQLFHSFGGTPEMVAEIAHLPQETYLEIEQFEPADIESSLVERAQTSLEKLQRTPRRRTR